MCLCWRDPNFESHRPLISPPLCPPQHSLCGIPHLGLLRLIWSHCPPSQSLWLPLGAGTRWQNPQPRRSSTGCLEKVGDRDRDTWEGPWVAQFRIGMPEDEACDDSCWVFQLEFLLGQDGMRLHKQFEGTSRQTPAISRYPLWPP